MFDKIWKFFSSLKLTAIIFSLLVISILVGSFIIQTPVAQEGQIERAYSPEVQQIFNFFGFFDLFHSSWFVFLMFMLGVNNICATIEMAPRHLKLFRDAKSVLPEAALKNLPKVSELSVPKGFSFERVAAILTKSLGKYFAKPVMTETDGGKKIFFANAGRWSHAGVYVVHVGVIVVLIGGVIGSLNGFEGQMNLMEGQTSNIVYIKNAKRRNRVLNFSIRCLDIRVDTYDNGAPKHYFSDLEVLDAAGKVVQRKTIQVNDPLEQEGINFYQANYGKQKTDEHKTYQLSLINRKTKKEIAFTIPEDVGEAVIPGTDRKFVVTHYNPNAVVPGPDGQAVELGEAIRVSETRNGKESFAMAFKDEPTLDEKLRPDSSETLVFRGMKEDFKLREVTGLQVAHDPGAAPVFLGFGIVTLGVFWTFFTSHRKVWVSWDGSQLLIAGKSNRDPWGLDKRFKNLVDAVESDLNSEQKSAPATA